LIDEDTCATNFMIRDKRMQLLVPDKKEPITPFISKIRALVSDFGVSCIIVIGASGEYFSVADQVIMMDSYVPLDMTQKAREIALNFDEQENMSLGSSSLISVSSQKPLSNTTSTTINITCKTPLIRGVFADPNSFIKTKTDGVDEIRFGFDEIDLSRIEQIVEESQTRAIADSLIYLGYHLIDNKRNLAEIMNLFEKQVENAGLDFLNDKFAHHDDDNDDDDGGVDDNKSHNEMGHYHEQNYIDDDDDTTYLDNDNHNNNSQSFHRSAKRKRDIIVPISNIQNETDSNNNNNEMNDRKSEVSSSTIAAGFKQKKNVFQASSGYYFGRCSLPRRFEIAAALNRLRSMEFFIHVDDADDAPQATTVVSTLNKPNSKSKYESSKSHNQIQSKDTWED